MLLIALEEHRVKLVNIFMQERRLLCKMQINSLYNQSSHFIQTILIVDGNFRWQYKDFVACL